MDYEAIYNKFNENNLDIMSNKVSDNNNLNTFAINIRNGKRTHQVSVNADRDINEDFDYNKETGVYRSLDKNKFGATDSFAEAIKRVYEKFGTNSEFQVFAFWQSKNIFVPVDNECKSNGNAPVFDTKQEAEDFLKNLQTNFPDKKFVINKANWNGKN